MFKVLAALGFYVIVGLAFWGMKKFSKKYLDPFFIIIMLLGIASMIQPFFMMGYTFGFSILLTGLAGYFISSHLPK